MAQAMSEPMFEINPESNYFKRSKAVRDANEKIYAIIDEIAEEYGFDAKEFPHYDSGICGFLSYSDGLKKFEKEVKKHSDRNGVHTFKKNSKMWQAIKPRMQQVADFYDAGPGPFALTDIAGINNSKYTQWVSGRMFIEVKDKEAVMRALNDPNRKKQLPVEPIMETPYEDYLKLILEAIVPQN